MVVVGARMVATQLLLMNHFLMSLSHNTADINAYHNSVSADVGECSYGCTKCSPINGCLACKPPFFLLLHRDGIRQTASCTRSCPRGFYKLKKKRNGFCTKCTMRGCVECVDSRYCSSCDTAFVNFFGKCIKQRSDESLEQLGLFTTTTNYDYLSTSESSGIWNLTTSTSATQTISEIYSASPPMTVSFDNKNPSIELPLPELGLIPLEATVAPPKNKPSTNRNLGTIPSIATRFHFTTPTSPFLFEHSSAGISPYLSPIPIQERKPCRRKGNRGRQRENGKVRKGHRGRKKDHRDRKYRRRKGRRGEQTRRRGCRRRDKNRRNKASRGPDGVLYSTHSSQDPVMRHLNSAEPSDNFMTNPAPQSRAELGKSNSLQSVSGDKVSLLGDTLSRNTKENTEWSKDVALHFRNSPRTMAAYKRSMALQRETAMENANPLQLRDHRVRHGRSHKDHTRRNHSNGDSYHLKKRPRTKSNRGRRRLGRGSRKSTEALASSSVNLE